MTRNGYPHMVLDDYVARLRELRAERRETLAAIRNRKQAWAYQDKVRAAIQRAFSPPPRQVRAQAARDRDGRTGRLPGRQADVPEPSGHLGDGEPLRAAWPRAAGPGGRRLLRAQHGGQGRRALHGIRPAPGAERLRRAALRSLQPGRARPVLAPGRAPVRGGVLPGPQHDGQATRTGGGVLRHVARLGRHPRARPAPGHARGRSGPDRHHRELRRRHHDHLDLGLRGALRHGRAGLLRHQLPDQSRERAARRRGAVSAGGDRGGARDGGLPDRPRPEAGPRPGAALRLLRAARGPGGLRRTPALLPGAARPRARRPLRRPVNPWLQDREPGGDGGLLPPPRGPGGALRAGGAAGRPERGQPEGDARRRRGGGWGDPDLRADRRDGRAPRGDETAARGRRAETGAALPAPSAQVASGTAPLPDSPATVGGGKDLRALRGRDRTRHPGDPAQAPRGARVGPYPGCGGGSPSPAPPYLRRGRHGAGSHGGGVRGAVLRSGRAGPRRKRARAPGRRHLLPALRHGLHAPWPRAAVWRELSGAPSARRAPDARSAALRGRQDNPPLRPRPGRHPGALRGLPEGRGGERHPEERPRSPSGTGRGRRWWPGLPRTSCAGPSRSSTCPTSSASWATGCGSSSPGGRT